MTVLLGGRVAEQIVFGAVTTGAASDLQRVEEITHAMVHEYAMGSGDAPQAALKEQALSDLTRRIRDEEQRELAFEAHRGALGPHHRPPRAAGPHRRRAARERDARARGRSTASWRACRASSAAGPCRDLRIAAAEKHAAGGRLDSGPGCSPGSTTSASPSRTSTPRSPCTKRPTAWPSPIARSSRSRASRPCCSTSARTTSSCCARWARSTPVGRFLAKRGPGLHHVAYQVADVRGHARHAARARPAAHRRDAAHRHPRLARRLPAPRLVGRRAHRDRPALGGTLTPCPSASASASRPAPRSPCGSATSSSPRLNDALGGEGWHEIEAEDGSVRLNLAHVLWVRIESDEHRVGFGLASSG